MGAEMVLSVIVNPPHDPFYEPIELLPILGMEQGPCQEDRQDEEKQKDEVNHLEPPGPGHDNSPTKGGKGISRLTSMGLRMVAVENLFSNPQRESGTYSP